MSNEDWRVLMQSLVDGEIAAPDFERAFLDAHRHAVDAGESLPYAADLMFYEVDAYCADPALRGPTDNDDAALRDHAERLLKRFDEPWPKLPGAPTEDDIAAQLQSAVNSLGLMRK